MVDKLKSNIEYVFCAGLGLLNFILFAFPYVSAYADFDLGSFGGSQSVSEGISGYSVMGDIWEGGFGGVMSSIVQIIIFIAGIALLAWGVCGLLNELGYLPVFPKKIGEFDNKQISELALRIMAALHVLQLIFLIIFTSSNSEDMMGFGSAGFRLSAGIFISLIIYAGAVGGLYFLKKKFPATEDGPSVSYVCSGCGKKAKATDKFCNACGGAIEEKVILPVVYVCEKCGAKASAKVKFCSTCGGAIVQKEIDNSENAE